MDSSVLYFSKVTLATASSPTISRKISFLKLLPSGGKSDTEWSLSGVRDR